MSDLEQMDPAVFYDHTLRFSVPSARDPHAHYMVELDSYQGNGRCDCEHFKCRLEPLLSRMVTPQEAVSRKAVKVPFTGRITDALRCKHLIDSRDQLASAVIKAIMTTEKIHAKTHHNSH